MTDTTPKEETPRCAKCDMPIDAEPQEYCASIAALHSEVETLRKRNEELDHEGESVLAVLPEDWGAAEYIRHLEAERDSWRRVAEKCESRAQEAETKLRDALKLTVQHMVNRFLNWKLPDDFAPDCGISFDIDKCRFGSNVHFPSGTNLFTATQAEAMIRYILKGATDE